MLHTDPVLCSDQRRIDAEVDLYNQVSYPRVPFLRSLPEEATRFTVIASFLAIKNWRRRRPGNEAITVTCTHAYREIAVTKFMQPMPILRCPHFVLLLRRSHKDALAPPTWSAEFWAHSSNLFRCVQNCTFSFSMQTEDVNIECESYKWTSYSPYISR